MLGCHPPSEAFGCGANKLSHHPDLDSFSQPEIPLPCQCQYVALSTSLPHPTQHRASSPILTHNVQFGMSRNACGGKITKLTHFDPAASRDASPCRPPQATNRCPYLLLIDGRKGNHAHWLNTRSPPGHRHLRSQDPPGFIEEPNLSRSTIPVSTTGSASYTSSTALLPRQLAKSCLMSGGVLSATPGPPCTSRPTVAQPGDPNSGTRGWSRPCLGHRASWDRGQPQESQLLIAADEE
jgi:hypothetical protein